MTDINYKYAKENYLYTEWLAIKCLIKDIEQSLPKECFIETKEGKYRIKRKMPDNFKIKAKWPS